MEDEDVVLDVGSEFSLDDSPPPVSAFASDDTTTSSTESTHVDGFDLMAAPAPQPQRHRRGSVHTAASGASSSIAAAAAALPHARRRRPVQRVGFAQPHPGHVAGGGPPSSEAGTTAAADPGYDSSGSALSETFVQLWFDDVGSFNPAVTAAERVFFGGITERSHTRQKRARQRASKLRSVDRWMSLFAAVIGTLVGSSGLTAVLYLDSGSPVFWPLLIGSLLSLASGIVSSVRSTLDLPARTRAAEDWAKGFGDLVAAISQFMTRPTASREDIEVFKATITQSYVTVTGSSHV